MNIQIPGKTFLLGEYAVLQGGAAVIVCTKPYFQLTVSVLFDEKKSLPCPPLQRAGSTGKNFECSDLTRTRDRTAEGVIHDDFFAAIPPFAKGGRRGAFLSNPFLLNPTTHSPFHPQSPAGKFIAAHADFFQSFHLDWVSPYPQGGFGGSTAEFLACFMFYMESTKQMFSQEYLYQTYLNYAYNNKGVPPSGADLIAQAQRQEGLVYFKSILSSPQVFSWPFTDISLLLFKTPNKLPTHDHLQNLKKLSDYTRLRELTVKGYQAFMYKDQKNFIQSINCYAEALNDLGLTAESTRQILKEWMLLPSCLAAKGCGAMGVDVIAVIAPTECKKNWDVIGSEEGFIRM